MEATKNRAAYGLDADVPQTGVSADAYNVATTALILRGHAPEGDGWLAPARHAVTLHRISGLVHKTSEASCNGLDESGEKRNERRESRLIESAREIASHYGLHLYHQTDPRGCALYLIEPDRIPSSLADLDRYTYAREREASDFPSIEKLRARWIDSNYNAGHAVVRLGR